MRRLGTGAVVAALLLSACGDGGYTQEELDAAVSDAVETALESSTTTEPVSPTSEAAPSLSTTSTTTAKTTTTTRPTTTTTTTPVTYSTNPIEFETSAGWQYLFAPQIQDSFNLRMEKSIEGSPPGQARVYIEVEIPQYSREAIPDTPGRNPPLLAFPLRFVQFPFRTGAVEEAFVASRPSKFDASNGFDCILSSDSQWKYRQQAHSPFRDDLVLPENSGIHCQVTGTFGGSNDFLAGWFEGDERVIDAIISEAATDPVLFFEFGGKVVGYCEVQLFPTGEVSVGSSLLAGECP